jgi:hypothetical protein
MRQALDSIVRELGSYVRRPKLRRGERLDFAVRAVHPTEDLHDAMVLTAYRWFPEAESPLTAPYREVSEAIPGIVLRRLAYGKSHVIDAVVSVMDRLVLILSAKPPKGWRMFARTSRHLPTWSRLRTRPS